jgi:hypothetical protein
MHNNNEIRKGKPRFVFTAAAVITAVMLLGTTAISTLTTAESVFAYKNNQATPQANDCGNGSVPIDTVLCQNIDSQIQGDGNAVALIAEQTFPERSVATCEGCFDVLTDGQRGAFLILLAQTFPGDFPDGVATLPELCDILEGLPPANQEVALGQITDVLQRTPTPIDPDTVTEIIDCLERVLGL